VVKCSVNISTYARSRYTLLNGCVNAVQFTVSSSWYYISKGKVIVISMSALGSIVRVDWQVLMTMSGATIVMVV